MLDFVNAIINQVTGDISLTTIGLVVAGIIGAGIVAIFAWKFARYGYRYVTFALEGRREYILEGKRQEYFAEHGKLPNW